MLILNRRLNEEVEIMLPDGECITVRVENIRKRDVKLGFNAPQSIVIKRKELTKSDTNGS